LLKELVLAPLSLNLVSMNITNSDTLRINVQGEINRRKLVKSGMLPQQLIANRLAQLDAIEKRVRAIP
jgi:hypothetical protein